MLDMLHKTMKNYNAQVNQILMVYFISMKGRICPLLFYPSFLFQLIYYIIYSHFRGFGVLGFWGFEVSSFFFLCFYKDKYTLLL